MRILLLGKNGQVGWELQRALAPLGELIALDRSGTAQFCGDLTNLEGLRNTVVNLKPDVIVNAAAYTAVDKAESEPELARQINSYAVAVLAEAAAQINSWFLHYSTDYVFDGDGFTPWKETSVPRPLNIYGQTKLEGENAVTGSGCKHLIFRTSWVYSARGNNFLTSILRLAKDREQLRIVDDQIGAPTSAELIADVTAQVIHQLQSIPVESGVYHLSAAGQVSWYGFACYVIQIARQAGEKLAVSDICPILSAEYLQLARRPLNSRLDCVKFQKTFGLEFPYWQVGVSRIVAEIMELK